MEALAIFIGGGLGSLSRWGIGRWLGMSAQGFPIGTLVANVLACLILGFLTGYVLLRAGVSRPVQLGAMTGFCGGFSTFSTFSQESFRLFENGKAMVGLLYIVASVLVCLAATALGYWLAQSAFK